MTAPSLTPDFDWARACDEKYRHKTEGAARHSGRDAIQRGGPDFSPRLYPYACMRCRGWHLTKRVDGANRATTAITARELYEGMGF